MANGAHPDGAYPIAKEMKGKRARDRGFIQIFLSHKQRDQRSAKEIREVLQTAAGRVQVFISENIARGRNWQEEIETQLYESDWFVLLFTGVEDEDWSWCHHEAGIFRGMMYPDADRVVVLHPPNVALPDPLRQFQAVKCQDGHPEDLHRFFEDLYGKEPYPGFQAINTFFANAKEAGTARQAAAETIIRAVGRLVVGSIDPKDVMIIHVGNKGDLLERAGFPADARIRRGSGALRLFELGDGEFSWQAFHEALDPEFRQALERSFWPAVHQACAKSVRSHRLVSMHTVLHSPADGKHYMPALSRIETTGDDSATFHITFVHVAAGTQAEVRHKSVARIFTALNLAHRFRWEIIDPYRDPVRLQGCVERHARTMDRDGDGATGGGGGLSMIWEKLRLIEIEAQNRGVYDPEALPADFGPHVEHRVREMFSAWEEHRARLQPAASAGDVATFAQVLTELDPVNVEFISLASQRLGELVRSDARTEQASGPSSARGQSTSRTSAGRSLSYFIQ
ncbi:MAG: toll/interleukin-1 receptor domain-containing protein [Geminicoccaceae bacterium]